MSYEPTINNGGAPVRVSREPVEKPFIQRGDYGLDEEVPHIKHSDGAITFECIELTLADPVIESSQKFRVTYHRAKVRRTVGRLIYLTVEPGTVVTWERIAE